MKRTEKTDKILVKYKQYLKLEKSLSDNTVDAYLTDLDKLLAYLTLENINILDVRLENLEDFSAGLHDIGIHPRSQARILSGIRSFYSHYFGQFETCLGGFQQFCRIGFQVIFHNEETVERADARQDACLRTGVDADIM